MTSKSFHMQNDLGDVDRMVVSLKTAVEGVLDDATMFKFEICASEALSNIVKHAASADKSDPILVQLSETKSSLNIAIFDPAGATPFDLRDHARDLDTVDPLAESGRGMGLIMQCADAVTYGSQDGRIGLILTFTKSGDF
ncbi:serine/threonine-protein kinase RsbW [Yoonia tamlensis]|uniref:Serine/threonine-protein kinase RsbW n=1 Tax=Yoonia tamlensis TaxID=390270 RepID=A0A1I6G992_9RHOB|nr:ATP-binding protein [Yoonia tamlensis]SFR38754.1 serine/threonine-protein kinase RsbW [Yoonia tamlensis]